MYILAQTLGAFAAAGVVYANYYSLIHEYDPDLTVAPSPTATAGIFATYPTEGVSKVNQFFSQFIASGLLVFVIFALKDDSNKGNFVASGAWFPLALLFLMVCHSFPGRFPDMTNLFDTVRHQQLLRHANRFRDQLRS